MIISMKDLEGSEILAGATSGQKALSRLITELERSTSEDVAVYLDFRGIEIATASYLRESVVEFRNLVRRRMPQFYPIVCNANDPIVEELKVLLEPRREVLLLCSLTEQGKPISPLLLGTLEAKQKLTYDLVHQLGETDAAELMKSNTGEEKVGQTAWNNRLSSLARLGLLVEENLGRAKRYRPLLQET